MSGDDIETESGQRMRAAVRAGVLVVMVEPGSVMAKHLVGRHHDGQPTMLLGASLNRVEGDVALMCNACGSFVVDHVQRGDPRYCVGCHSQNIAADGVPS